MRARDVPAAHSMDTTWFAVDAEGYVASFESFEAGAVPNDATMSPEGGDFDAWPLDAIMAAKALAAGTFFDEDDETPPPSYRQGVVLVLRPDAEERPTTYRDGAGRTYSVHERLGGEFLVIQESEPRIVSSRGRIEPNVLAAYGDDEGVERVVYEGEIVYWREDGGGMIFHFSHDDYVDPGAYKQRTSPIEPLSLDALPEALREQLGKLRFDVSFAEVSELHLADHLADEECSMWDPDGSLRGAPEDEVRAGPVDASAAPPRSHATLMIVGAILLLSLAALWMLAR